MDFILIGQNNSSMKLLQNWIRKYLFYAKVNFGHMGFCIGKSENYNYIYILTIAAIVPKIGLNTQMNELMKLKECQRWRCLYDLGQRSIRFQNWNLFFSDTIESFVTKFHLKDYDWMGMKI